jgi:hypothetical protein
MVQLPPRKGPRMTVASERNKTQDFGRDELETEVNAFARKIHKAIEGARSKMTDKEREEADRNAEVIFENASSAAKRPQKSA